MFSDAGSRYVQLIEASIRARVRPTTMILGKDNRKRWSQMDLLVMQAYEQFQSELCTEHGGPRWLCRSDDPTLQVRLKEVPACFAAEEVRAYEEKHADDDEKKSVVPEFYSRIDLPLHKYRERYYDALAATAAENDED